MLIAVPIFPHIFSTVRPISDALAVFFVTLEFSNVFYPVIPQVDPKSGILIVSIALGQNFSTGNLGQQ